MDCFSTRYLLLALTLLLTSTGCSGSCVKAVLHGIADHEADAEAIVGTWKCENSDTKSTYQGYREYKKDGTYNATGTSTDRTGLWKVSAAFEYEFREGKFCKTFTHYSKTPMNAKARSHKRKRLNAVGERVCTAYTLEKDTLLFHHSFGDTTCKRSGTGDSEMRWSLDNAVDGALRK